MLYPFLKGMHVVSFVSWFAALFYIVRLFIYDVEANERPDAARDVLQDQLRLMQRRLWLGIGWPAMIATLIFGLALLWQYPAPNSPWVWFKLSLVLTLVIYHLLCHRLLRQLKQGKVPLNSQQLRVFNEIATLLLLGIAFTATMKHLVFDAKMLLGLLAFVALLVWGLRASARRRRNASS